MAQAGLGLAWAYWANWDAWLHWGQMGWLLRHVVKIIFMWKTIQTIYAMGFTTDGLCFFEVVPVVVIRFEHFSLRFLLSPTASA